MVLKPDCGVRRSVSLFFPLCPDTFQNILCGPLPDMIEATFGVRKDSIHEPFRGQDYITPN